MNAPNKIRATHLERTAIVHVRQSTLVQSASTPSRRRANTGWSRSRSVGLAGLKDVIDADLGQPGRSAERRSGFREVVSRVCLGEVGAIFGLEVSRLARSSADLARLLELARLTDTLVVNTMGCTTCASSTIGCWAEQESVIDGGRMVQAVGVSNERIHPRERDG